MLRLCLQPRQDGWFRMALRPPQQWLLPTALACLLFPAVNALTSVTQVGAPVEILWTVDVWLVIGRGRLACLAPSKSYDGLLAGTLSSKRQPVVSRVRAIARHWRPGERAGASSVPYVSC